MSTTPEPSLSADKAQEALLDALRTGQLRGGQFLSMAQLVELLDCPIAAIREAVKQASSQGLLVTFPKRGLQVMDVTSNVIRDCLDFRKVLDQEGARRHIAAGATDALPELREHHLAMQRNAAAGSEDELPSRAIRVDLSLHDFLASGLQNKQLQAAYDANRMRIAIIQNARPFLQDRIVSAMEEHLAIIDALQACDTAAALAAIQYHYAQTLRWWGVT